MSPIYLTIRPGVIVTGGATITERISISAEQIKIVPSSADGVSFCIILITNLILRLGHRAPNEVFLNYSVAFIIT